VQIHPSTPSTEEKFKKEQCWSLSHGQGATGPVRLITGTGGLWACAASCCRGLDAGCAAHPFPGITPVLGCQALTLAGEMHSEGQSHSTCGKTPREGLGASSPAPSAPAEPNPCSPLPGGPACLLRPTGTLPAAGLGSCLPSCADVCWWQDPKRG